MTSRTGRLGAPAALLLGGALVVAAAQAPAAPPPPNAALRYWMAFAQMQNPPADVLATELAQVESGELPIDESRHGPVLDANAEALGTMLRATRLPACDWGLEAVQEQRERLLELAPETGARELMAQAREIGTLEQPGAERAVNLDRASDDRGRVDHSGREAICHAQLYADYVPHTTDPARRLESGVHVERLGKNCHVDPR